MTTRGFSGGAGTGKTTSLLRELDLHLDFHPLKPTQRVLALTFMHGSRRRLADRLAKSKARRQCECMTIDRFAWEICRRWRTRARAAGGMLPLDLGAGNFDAVCAVAGRLLTAQDVVRWVASRYPVIILDEFQDCAIQRVAIAQALHGRVKLLIAADDFQNLNLSAESPAVTWLRGLGVCEELTVNHRTSDTDLLNAARALRNGEPLVAGTGTSFMIKSVQQAAMAAGYISKTMWPAAGKNVVLLSPAKPASSSWVRNVVELVSTKKYGAKKDVGPIPIQWEASPENAEAQILAALGLDKSESAVPATALLTLTGGPVASRMKQWAKHQRRVLGRTEFSPAEISALVKRTIHQVRSFGSPPPASRRAMTIHQAKNREFEVVIILWPFEVKGDAVRLRRLLYNAVTRAKRRAIVIVNDPKRNRLQSGPFACAASAAVAPADAVPVATRPIASSLVAPPVPTSVGTASPTTLYFAYGSNLWEQQMARRCPGHQKIGKATLVGFRWIITTRGVANIVASRGHSVEGTLFRITKPDEDSLDKWERVAEGAYCKERHPVQCDGTEHADVLVYVDPVTETGKPQAEYIRRINHGVRDAGLSVAYVATHIRAFVPAPQPANPEPATSALGNVGTASSP